VCALGAAKLTPNIAGLVVYEPTVIGMGPDELPTPVLEEIDAPVAQGRLVAAALLYQAVVGWSVQEIEQLRADPS
jgi:hypothetical protein